MQVAILGRQAALSLAELESLCGANVITSLNDEAALVDTNEPLPQDRLGGTLKCGKLLTILEETTLSEAFSYLQDTIPEHLHYLPEGKLQLGVSCYGIEATPAWLLAQLLKLKKTIKSHGRSVRIIENKTAALESAQVLYNKLTGPLGWEFLLIKRGDDVVLAQTTGVQNIDDYSKRDFGRPKRDTYVGMLPPKLAQIMINLTDHHALSDATKTTTTSLPRPVSLFDPFCGTGVILQEALLMGYEAYGSDISEKMVDYTQDNLNWLQTSQNRSFEWHVEVADATKHTWKQPLDLVVCETFLGTPLTSPPTSEVLTPIRTRVNDLVQLFLENLLPQLSSDSRVCLALPAWQLKDMSFVHLPILDRLTDMGYNRIDFVHAKHSGLIYHRPEQIVGRELVILTKA